MQLCKRVLAAGASAHLLSIWHVCLGELLAGHACARLCWNREALPMESKTRSALNGAGWKLRSACGRQNRQLMTAGCYSGRVCMHACSACRQAGATPQDPSGGEQSKGYSPGACRRDLAGKQHL